MIRHVGLQGRLVGWIGIGAMGLLLGLALFYGGAVASGSRAQGTSQESARAEIAGAGRLAERLSRYDPLPTWTPLACGTHSNYAITQSAGAAIVAGTALVPGSQGDNVMTVITLPFRYYLYGAGLDQMNADSNGKLQVSVVNSSQPDNICLPDANQAWAILPYWDDLDTSASIPSSLGPLGIYTSVSGIEPNRIFNIEWRACLFNSGTCGGEVNFEVRLYENDRTFDIIYGAVPGGGSGATVGAETYDRGRYTQYQCDTGRLSPGLLLNFSLPTCPPEPTATPITYDSFAHLEPAAATPLVVGVNSKFTLDLLINSGDSGLNIASAQQSYLTFTYTLLKNVRADSAGCIASNTVTAITDAGFETELQNNACNGPGPCAGPNAPAGSIAFASGSFINPGVSGDFPVARMAFCGTAPGTAIIHWQFAPTAPITRESEVVGPDSLPVSNPALYNGGNGDYIVQIVGPTSTPTFTRTPTRTPTRTATPTSTTPTATPVRSIRGHLVWQGRPPQPNPLQQLPLTITLRLQGGGPATELTGLTTDASGTFIADVTSVPGGDYDLRLKGPQFLATSGTVILPGVPVVTNLEMYEQRSGDCDNNNVVSWSDFFILRSSFGMDSHSPMYDGRADLDGDLRVGFGDFSLLVSNFNRWGAEPLSGNLPR